MIDSNPSKKAHIPFCDVDDLSFKNRHDPNFIASITNIMQVPTSITLTNGKPIDEPLREKREQQPVSLNSYSSFYKEKLYGMDIPEKLTVYAETTEIKQTEMDEQQKQQRQTSESNNFEYRNDDSGDGGGEGDEKELMINESIEENFAHLSNNEQLMLKTPQLASELFKRQNFRRSSIEIDLHQEIRLLRDKVNRLEHECQQNTQSSRLFYACICGYLIIKSFNWLLNNK